MISVYGISGFTHKQIQLNLTIETIYGTSKIGLSCEMVIIVMPNVCRVIQYRNFPDWVVMVLLLRSEPTEYSPDLSELL